MPCGQRLPVSITRFELDPSAFAVFGIVPLTERLVRVLPGIEIRKRLSEPLETGVVSSRSHIQVGRFADTPDRRKAAEPVTTQQTSQALRTASRPRAMSRSRLTPRASASCQSRLGRPPWGRGDCRGRVLPTPEPLGRESRRVLKSSCDRLGVRGQRSGLEGISPFWLRRYHAQLSGRMEPEAAVVLRRAEQTHQGHPRPRRQLCRPPPAATRTDRPRARPH
jgi:hypothetical protein